MPLTYERLVEIKKTELAEDAKAKKKGTKKVDKKK